MIEKCKGCLRQVDALHGECPHYRGMVDRFADIGVTLGAMQGRGKLATINDLFGVIPQEFLNYDFSCIFYSPKPTTEGAFL